MFANCARLSHGCFELIWGAPSILGMMHSGKSLQSILNGKYAAEEKFMSLRNPDRERLFNLFKKIEFHTEELNLALESDYPVNLELVENAQRNKKGFDSHEHEWLRRISERNNGDNSSDIGTVIFNASPHSSVRRPAAEAKSASAKLELEQLSERVQEQLELFVATSSKNWPI